MSDQSRPVTNLPPEQEAIRARCFHPTGSFVKFDKEEIEQSIPARFEKIVRQYPDRLAVKMGNLALTYGELNKTANQVARAILAARGEGSEPIALLFEHGVEGIAAMLGVLKAGKFFVVIDPMFPRERILYLLEDSQAALIVTNNRNVALADQSRNGTGVLLNIDEIDDSFPSDNPGVRTSPDDLASIRYTSGSTGQPKGAVETHRNALHAVRSTVNDEMHTCADDRLSLLHSLSFAAAHTHLFSSLLNGASLFPFDIRSDGVPKLAKWLEEENITVLHILPAPFRQLAEFLSDRRMLLNLRLIRLSGAPITQLDFTLYKENFADGILLAIGMASTEMKRICYAVLDKTFSFPREGAPIGYPCRDKEILLLGEDGREVETHEVGEIAVKGSNLNPGYWRKPQLNEAKFIADPAGGSERIYLTGDFGRMLHDGLLIHLGRKDFQVKIRGYRVEVGEIETTLINLPTIKEAVVIAQEDLVGDKRLVAYIVVAGKPPPTVSGLRRALAAKLPDYMIPSVFVLLDAIPLNASGKVDRGMLPLPIPARPEMESDYVPPGTPVEKALAIIWTEVLGIDRVGSHDNFFDLGGNSLLATQIVSRVIKQFELALPLQSLFQSPTVAEMAILIKENRGKTVDENGLNRIFADLEALSEDDAQLLADKSK
jgi:amino acid adenylation domain-containing protein